MTEPGSARAATVWVILRPWCDVVTNGDRVDDVDAVGFVHGSPFQSVQVRSEEPPGTSAAGRQRQERS
jgi:hypothetical protein